MIVTLFNAKYDKETRTDKIYRTILKDEALFITASKGAGIVKTGLVTKDGITIIIPERLMCNYVSPKEYQALTNIGTKWTLKEGNKIAKGEINENPTTLVDLEKEYDFIYTITSVEIKDYGGLAHIKVGGV
jgi:hypothetical protein